MDNRAVLTCRHITNENATPAFAVRDKPVEATDSGWQFLCGSAHDASDVMIISMDEAVRFCPALASIKDELYPCKYIFTPSGEPFTKQK